MVRHGIQVLTRPPQQDEVWLVDLNPTRGTEIQKTRPCIVVSPNEMNVPLQTVIVAPLTTVLRSYPTRVPIHFQGKSGQIVLDQIRAVDRQRLIKKLGNISRNTALTTSAKLVEMFSRS